MTKDDLNEYFVTIVYKNGYKLNHIQTLDSKVNNYMNYVFDIEKNQKESLVKKMSYKLMMKLCDINEEPVFSNYRMFRKNVKDSLINNVSKEYYILPLGNVFPSEIKEYIIFNILFIPSSKFFF